MSSKNCKVARWARSDNQGRTEAHKYHVTYSNRLHRREVRIILKDALYGDEDADLRLERHRNDAEWNAF